MDNSTQRQEIATAIAPVVSETNAEKTNESSVLKKKQVNPATLPTLKETVDITTLKARMLATAETVKARAKYEEFINSLDMSEYPDRFDQVSFGDLLHVTPALPTNKRKLDSLLTIDSQLASVYVHAQEIYESLLKKTENAKLANFAKRKKLSQKKSTEKPDQTSVSTAEKTTEIVTTATKKEEPN